MKHCIFFLALILLCLACGPIDIKYRFRFDNNSEKDIYIIFDLNPNDEMISTGSLCYYVIASNYKYIYNNRPWDTVVKDSTYMYVIDANMIHLPCDRLSEENVELITPQMILARKTVFHSQLTDKHFSISYP